MQYTLVYGLAADPIHQAHISLVSGATKALIARGNEIAKILIIPTYRHNPIGIRKDDLPDTFEDRFAICELAAIEIAQQLEGQAIPVEVSRIEEKLAKRRKEPNYSVETLSALQAGEASGTNLIFLLGCDLVSGNDPEFRHWYKPDKLIQLATIVICPRPGYKRNEQFLMSLKEKGAHFIYLDELPAQDIASNQLKKRLENGEDPLALSDKGWLPRSIAIYIRENNFFISSNPSINHSS